MSERNALTKPNEVVTEYSEKKLKEIVKKTEDFRKGGGCKLDECPMHLVPRVNSWIKWIGGSECTPEYVNSILYRTKIKDGKITIKQGKKFDER